MPLGGKGDGRALPIGRSVATAAGAQVRIADYQPRRSVLVVFNEDAANGVRLGARDRLSATAGYLLPANGVIALDGWIAELYAFPAAGTPTISTLEQVVE